MSTWSLLSISLPLFDRTGDAAENAVHETRGLVFAAVSLCEFDGLVDRHRNRHLVDEEHLVGRKAQDGAVDDRHAIERPVLGRRGEAAIDVVSMLGDTAVVLLVPLAAAIAISILFSSPPERLASTSRLI